MKELDALMNALNEKGISKSLRLTAKVVPFPEDKDTPEKKQALLDEAIKHSLAHHFADNESLGEMFGAFAYELGMNALKFGVTRFKNRARWIRCLGITGALI